MSSKTRAGVCGVEGVSNDASRANVVVFAYRDAAGSKRRARLRDADTSLDGDRLTIRIGSARVTARLLTHSRVSPRHVRFLASSRTWSKVTAYRVAVAHRRQLVGDSPPRPRTADLRTARGRSTRRCFSASRRSGRTCFTSSTSARVPRARHARTGMSGRFSSPDPTRDDAVEAENREDGIVALLSAIGDLMDESGYHLKRRSSARSSARTRTRTRCGQVPRRAQIRRPRPAWTARSRASGTSIAPRFCASGAHPEQLWPTSTARSSTRCGATPSNSSSADSSYGSILTVDPEEAAILGEPWTRRAAYNDPVVEEGARQDGDMANRTVTAARRASRASAQSPSARGARARHRKGARSVRVALRARRGRRRRRIL